MTLPTFFFSHARRDSEQPGRYLLRFFEDLERRLAQWAAVNPPLGTLDRRIEHGADWDDTLSAGLARNKAFIAIFTPLYSTRTNCAKELGVFLLRSPGLGIDAVGQLTGIANVLLIQWMPREAYAVNGEQDALIPQMLRRVEDVPAQSIGDPQKFKAVDRYRRHGMERCVSPGTFYYRDLLDLIVQRIVALPELPPATAASFGTAFDAFKHDWYAHFKVARHPVSGPPTHASVPRPLETLVVFHVTDRPYRTATVQCAFSEHLLVDPAVESDPADDAALAQLMSDARSAAVDEGMSIFHAVSPFARLLGDLQSLSNQNVLVAVVVDQANPVGADLRTILCSSQWRGVVLRTLRTAPLPPAIERILPDDRPQRRELMRRVFVEARGVALRASDMRTADAERLPMLHPPHGARQ